MHNVHDSKCSMIVSVYHIARNFCGFRKLSPRELSAITCKDLKAWLPVSVIPQTLCNEMLLEAIPRNISASKISHYTVYNYASQENNSLTPSIKLHDPLMGNDELEQSTNPVN